MEHRVYVVCNPATQEIWAALPVPDTQQPGAPLVRGKYITCLCFDPAVPSRFTVLVLTCDLSSIEAVDVYSSDTGGWTSMASGWGPGIRLLDAEPGYIFFLNGTLHFPAYHCGEDTFDSEGNINIKLLIATVDMDGSTWRTIRMPRKIYFSFIGQSQGHLYGMQVGCDCRISVWLLEDYASGHSLKHRASVSELLGRPCRKPGEFYKLVAIHPERNLLFLAGGVKTEETLVSYDMDNKKLRVICTLAEYDTGTFLPYIPCFAERSSAAQ